MVNKTGKGGQKKGEPSRNPSGKPPGYQNPLDRMKRWFEQHTAGEILDILQDPEEKWKKLCAMDVAIIQRVKEAFEKDGRQSLDGLLDRMLGKPAQYIETKNDTTITHKPVSATSEWLEDTLGAGQAKPPEKPVSH